ncbi:uncharacterized protein LOC122036834 [Zingiber officinale]|uniref:uncharacterized protein LOC122036834 n=1 Tax=Zingiber officinale TaxID=94328 RepID=UPI001C4CA170|nr:uncharacterized protein LOC122036834 [Zingiber officinale]
MVDTDKINVTMMLEEYDLFKVTKARAVSEKRTVDSHPHRTPEASMDELPTSEGRSKRKQSYDFPKRRQTADFFSPVLLLKQPSFSPPAPLLLLQQGQSTVFSFASSSLLLGSTVGAPRSSPELAKPPEEERKQNPSCSLLFPHQQQHFLLHFVSSNSSPSCCPILGSTVGVRRSSPELVEVANDKGKATLVAVLISSSHTKPLEDPSSSGAR